MGSAPATDLVAEGGGGWRGVCRQRIVEGGNEMSSPSVINRFRRVLSPALWIAFATWMVVGLNAGSASAAPNLIEICHKGRTISVGINAVPHLLEQGARL